MGGMGHDSGDISCCHGVLTEVSETRGAPTLQGFKTKKEAMKTTTTYLYCETAIGCRFSQVDVVEFSDKKEGSQISF